MLINLLHYYYYYLMKFLKIANIRTRLYNLRLRDTHTHTQACLTRFVKQKEK